MPALNFKKQFAPRVEDGTKRQSIRAGNRFKVGDDVHLYTGMRTKACRRLRPVVKCASAEKFEIRITKAGVKSYVSFRIGGKKYEDIHRMRLLAQADGFSGLTDMLMFFDKTHGLPFKGQLIKW